MGITLLISANDRSSCVPLYSNFSSGKPLEYIETDKARVVVLELEKDWWIVAVSIARQLNSETKVIKTIPVYRPHPVARRSSPDFFDR